MINICTFTIDVYKTSSVVVSISRKLDWLANVHSKLTLCNANIFKLISMTVIRNAVYAMNMKNTANTTMSPIFTQILITTARITNLDATMKV